MGPKVSGRSAMYAKSRSVRMSRYSNNCRSSCSRRSRTSSEREPINSWRSVWDAGSGALEAVRSARSTMSAHERAPIALRARWCVLCGVSVSAVKVLQEAAVIDLTLQSPNRGENLLRFRLVREINAPKLRPSTLRQIDQKQVLIQDISP